MGKIILNANSGKFRKIRRVLDKKGRTYVASKSLQEFKRIILSSGNELVIGGGDGTINAFVNIYMQLPKRRKNKIRLGIIPCGRANDLWRHMAGRPGLIDIIEVNGRFFVTGGGFGLPCEVAEKAKCAWYRGIMTSDGIYAWIVLQKLIFGYKGIDGHMLISVSNQPFIGKHFRISPEASNDDGLMDICLVRKSGFFGDMKTVAKIMAGNHRARHIRKKGYCISFNSPKTFMADGELLCTSKIFRFKVHKKSLSMLAYKI